MSLDEYFLVRPSVAIVPIDSNHVDFFLSSVRKNLRTKLDKELFLCVSKLDGKKTVLDLASEADICIDKLLKFFNFLISNSVIETQELRDFIDNNPDRRTLNFIGDLVPYSNVLDAQSSISKANVCIVGLGAVGSLIANQLTSMGFRNFILIDDDVVNWSNLNRSDFEPNDVGKLKVDTVEERIYTIRPDANVDKITAVVSDQKQLIQLLSTTKLDCIINCADFPNADHTNNIVNSYALHTNTPMLIAGGYNLHLSIIGMTIIPGETACTNCSKLTLDEIGQDISAGIKKLSRKERNLGNMAPTAAITSSFCALEVLRVALRPYGVVPAMINRRGEYNFFGSKISFTEIPPRQECGCICDVK